MDVCCQDSGKRIPLQAGFTLVELAIVVAIIVVLAAIAIPSYLNYVLDTRIAAETDNFLNILTQARGEAMESGKPVSICPSTDGATCNSTRWGDGWIVFTDGDTPGKIDGDDYVVRKGQPLDDKIDLKIDSGGAAYIRFLPNELRFAR